VFVAWHPIYAHPLPEGHRFPMLKYDLIPQQLLHEGIIHSSEIHRPQAIERDILDLTHDTQYLNSLFDLSIDAKAMRKIGFPLSKELVERECIITQGTIDCAEYALTNGAALNVAGGTHHAYIDRGEGFCIFNDFAVTCNYLLHKNHRLRCASREWNSLFISRKRGGFYL
jgi:acetoin utilization deacetylase AcuC-like enzyme